MTSSSLHQSTPITSSGESSGLATSEPAPIRKIPLASIRAQRYGKRSRIGSEELHALADSIRTLGLLYPIDVVAEGDGFVLISGARRLTAVDLLGWETVPARVREVDPTTEMSIAMAENMAREAFNPKDEARLVKQLREEGEMSVKEIAKAIGRTEPWVRQRLDFCTWPEHIQDVVDEGKLALHSARRLMEITDEAYRDRLLHHAVMSGCTVEQAGMWVRDWKANDVARTPAELEELHPAAAPENIQISHRCKMCDELYDWQHTEACYICLGCKGELERAKYGGMG